MKKLLRSRKLPMLPTFVFSIFCLVALLLPTSYIVLMPGPADDVTATHNGQKLVEVSGVESYPSDTHLFMTTVSSAGTADSGTNGAVVVSALFDSSSRILPVRALYAPQDTDAKVSQQDQLMMTSSQDTAAAVAMEKAGLPVKMTLTVVGKTNDKVDFHKGDVIKSVQVSSAEKPVEITTFGFLAHQLSTVDPGSNIIVHVSRDGQDVAVPVTTVAHKPDFDGTTLPGSLLGVYLQVSDVSLPAQANYLIEGIGGPSAGNIFTLAIYDQLTPGSLGNAHNIAGTGEISWDGRIGPIGGIEQKLVGADQTGATDFLAPAMNCFQTAGHIPAGMRVWAVRNIDDSIAAVRAIGEGNTSGLTPCSAVPAPQPQSADGTDDSDK